MRVCKVDCFNQSALDPDVRVSAADCLKSGGVPICEVAFYPVYFLLRVNQSAGKIDAAEQQSR
jgi:hypothetical protein